MADGTKATEPKWAAMKMSSSMRAAKWKSQNASKKMGAAGKKNKVMAAAKFD